jgi:plasmid stabilization system protein ParE
VIVVVADEAAADLERIADYIAKDNPARALSFVRELRECCESLGETPEGFPLVPRHESSGVRRRVYGNYLIFYRAGATTIDVLHVLHGAIDYEPALFPKE